MFSVLAGMLPVLDDIDRAREHGELEGGFKAVADSLERIVAAHGLTKFGAPGDEFDPRLHEALMHAHSPDVTTTTCQNIVSGGLPHRRPRRTPRPGDGGGPRAASPSRRPTTAPDQHDQATETRERG